MRCRSTGQIVQIDWKRVRNIRSEPFVADAHGRPPLTSVPDTNLHHYYLQQNLYARMLAERAPELTPTGGMFLVVCHPNHTDKRPHFYEVPRMDAEIDAILAERRAEVDAVRMSTTSSTTACT
jgi:hypothetical protein